MALEFAQGDWRSHQRLLAALPGPVDILVNNAAVGTKTVERYTDGALHGQDEAFLRVNSVGGGVSQFPAFHVADGMSKAALAYLTRHVAAELVHAI